MELTKGLRAWWRFDEVDGSAAIDSVTGFWDAVHDNFGRPVRKPGVEGQALFFDGYSTWVTRQAAKAPRLGPAFTLSAWLALATFPVNTAAIIARKTPGLGSSGARPPEAASKRRGEGGGGYAFVVSPLGQWGLELCIDGVWHAVWADRLLPLGRWVHVACTFQKDQGVSLFLDGERVTSAAVLMGDLNVDEGADLVIGRDPSAPFAARIFPTGVLHGLVDEVRIYDRALADGEVRALAQAGAAESAGDVEPAAAAGCGAAGSHAGPGRRPASLVGRRPDLFPPEDRFAGDRYRPGYHLIPPANWTNEPHGPVYWMGEYHVFYQANPSGPYWGHIHWGHASSPDLVHWTHWPAAIRPEPASDRLGIWSGCTVVDSGRVVAFYTSEHRGEQAQNLAWASDERLLAWAKHPRNPVIPGPPRGFEIVSGFRDPYVWRHGDVWYMIVGCGLKGVGGTVFLYRSYDLETWEYRGRLFTGDESQTGQFWEMPQFVNFGRKWALIVNEWPGSKRGWYWIGEFVDERFRPETGPVLVDLGEHYLSPTVMIDPAGRRLAFGVIKESRSSEDQLAAGWANLFGLPRVLELDEKRGVLLQRPAPELRALRREHFRLESLQTGHGRWGRLVGGEFEIPPNEVVRSPMLEARILFAPGEWGRIGLRLFRSAGGEEETLLYYDPERGRMVVDKERSSLNPGVEKGTQGGPFRLDPGEPLELHVFIDHSVLEVFINGRATLTTRVYPTLEVMPLAGVFSEAAGRTVQSIDVWRLDKISHRFG